jgi:hypothetical protein
MDYLMLGCIAGSTSGYVLHSTLVVMRWRPHLTLQSIVSILYRYEHPMSSSLPDGHMMMLFRLVALLVLSIVLICPIDDTIQGEGFTHFYCISLSNLVTIIP